MDPDSSFMLRILVLLFLLAARWVCAHGERERDHRRPGSLAIASTFIGLCAAGIGVATFTAPLANLLHRAIPVLPLGAGFLISFVLIVLLLAFLLRICADVPDRIPVQKASRFTRLLEWVFTPFGWLLLRWEGALLSLLGYPPSGPEDITEEEFRMLIDVGERDGTFEESEKAMLEGILELSDSTAAAMMTHRTEITALPKDATLSEVIGVALESGHSRIPVYEEDLDTIAGILYVKDLLALVGMGKVEEAPFDLGMYLREPLYVLETTPAGILLGQFKAKKIQIAIVVDEYGGTSGLVSMEDLLEEIVGNIQDEYDDEEEEIAPLEDNLYLVDGLTALDDVLKYFNLEDIEEAEEYDTIGGFFLGMQGGPLNEAEEPVSLWIGNVEFTIREMDRSRIAKLQARVVPMDEMEDME